MRKANFEIYENMVNRILMQSFYYHRKGAKNAKKKSFMLCLIYKMLSEIICIKMYGSCLQERQW